MCYCAIKTLGLLGWYSQSRPKVTEHIHYDLGEIFLW